MKVEPNEFGDQIDAATRRFNNALATARMASIVSEINRDSVSGEFVSQEYAKEHPDTTQKETVARVHCEFEATVATTDFYRYVAIPDDAEIKLGDRVRVTLTKVSK